jgi:tRNA pseudouridine13 synthase
MQTQNQFYLSHSKVDVYFKQSKDDFVVTEIPLYEFSGEGEHIIIKLRKKDLSTWDALQIIANTIGCKNRDIGYAGLKDKNALTIQHISIHKQYLEQIEAFEHPLIKFLETTRHNNKIKIGHLKGNKFFIRIKRVLPKDNYILENILQQIATYGIPNYFGFQRFGIDGDNYIKGKAIIDEELKEKNIKLKKMYLNSYQSHLFNNWLSQRIEISKLINGFKPKEIADKLQMSIQEVSDLKKQKHPFKVMLGDVMSHYPYGKIFHIEELQIEADKFNLRDRVPTGLLPGKKAKMALDMALKYEKDNDVKTTLDGTRRFAWIFLDDISSKYNEEKNHFELEFSLPKGSYATEVIRELIH